MLLAASLLLALAPGLSLRFHGSRLHMTSGSAPDSRLLIDDIATIKGKTLLLDSQRNLVFCSYLNIVLVLT